LHYNKERKMPIDPSIHETAFTVKDAVALRGRFLVLGLFNIVLGVATILLRVNTDYPVVVTVGLALMLAGAADAWHAMLLRSKMGYMLSWMSSVLFFFGGALLVFAPIAKYTSLHMALALIFWIGGVLRMGKGIDIRPVNSWPWVVASGLLALVFGFAILYQGEACTIEFISLLVGINLIVDGWSRMIVFWVHE
jgi:uncharacterized membrane protein HdeD (DUF308 family)